MHHLRMLFQVKKKWLHPPTEMYFINGAREDFKCEDAHKDYYFHNHWVNRPDTDTHPEERFFYLKKLFERQNPRLQEWNLVPEILYMLVEHTHQDVGYSQCLKTFPALGDVLPAHTAKRIVPPDGPPFYVYREDDLISMDYEDEFETMPFGEEQVYITGEVIVKSYQLIESFIKALEF